MEDRCVWASAQEGEEGEPGKDMVTVRSERLVVAMSSWASEVKVKASS